jgi:hypothetical protein
LWGRSTSVEGDFDSEPAIKSSHESKVANQFGNTTAHYGNVRIWGYFPETIGETGSMRAAYHGCRPEWPHPETGCMADSNSDIRARAMHLKYCDNSLWLGHNSPPETIRV